MLGFPLLYFKGMRLMFQLSGFYYRSIISAKQRKVVKVIVQNRKYVYEYPELQTRGQL